MKKYIVIIILLLLMSSLLLFISCELRYTAKEWEEIEKDEEYTKMRNEIIEFDKEYNELVKAYNSDNSEMEIEDFENNLRGIHIPEPLDEVYFKKLEEISCIKLNKKNLASNLLIIASNG